MNKLFLFLSIVLVVLLGNTSFAETTTTSSSGGGGGGGYSFTYENVTSTNSGGVIDIEAGVSKSVSFSNELSSIVFSKSTDISIKTLEGGVWRDVGNDVSNFKPLSGFIITNHSGDNLSITYKYKASIDSLSSLIQKRLPAGWNLIGISQNSSESQFNTISNGLGYDFNYSQIVDFTASNFGSSNNTNDLSSNFNIKNRNESGYLFENKSYAVFNNASSVLGGSMNLTDNNGNLIYRNIVTSGGGGDEPLNNTSTIEVTLNPNTPTDVSLDIGESGKLMSIDLTAGSQDYTVDNILLNSGLFYNNPAFDELYFKKDDNILTSTGFTSTGTYEAITNFSTGFIVKAGSTETLDLYGKVKNELFYDNNNIRIIKVNDSSNYINAYSNNIQTGNSNLSLNRIDYNINYNQNYRYIRGMQDKKIYDIGINGSLSGVTLENIGFVITPSENEDYELSDFNGIKLSYSGAVIKTNPNITQSGSDIKISFENINNLFNTNNGNYNIEILSDFATGSTIKNYEINFDTDNIGFNYNGVDFTTDNFYPGRDNYQVSIYETPILSISDGNQSYNSKLALSEEKDVVFSDLRFNSNYGDTKITELYFANDSNGDNGINADISNEIIENIRLEVNDVIHTGTVVLNNGRLAITGLDITIPKYINSGNNDTVIKLLGDIAIIDSDTKTNKKITFRLTDLRAKSIVNDNVITKVGNYDINKQFAYTLHEGLNISGNLITTRKSTFIIDTLNLTDTVLDNGEKTIWKGNITANGGDVNLARLDFRFNGFLNNISMNNLSLSGSNNTGSYLVDNNGNKILSDFNLYIDGEKVEYRNEFKNNYFNIQTNFLRTVFTPVNIFSGNTVNIELKATFSNIKANDYFYVNQGYYYLYSDKSAGLNHSETSNDWFSDMGIVNGNTSGTLIKE